MENKNENQEVYRNVIRYTEDEMYEPLTGLGTPRFSVPGAVAEVSRSTKVQFPEIYSYIYPEYYNKLKDRLAELGEENKMINRKRNRTFRLFAILFSVVIFSIITGLQAIGGVPFNDWLLSVAMSMVSGVLISLALTNKYITPIKNEYKEKFDQYIKDRNAWKMSAYLRNIIRDETVTYESVIMGNGNLTIDFYKNGQRYTENFNYKKWPDDPDMTAPFLAICNEGLYGRGAAETETLSFSTSMIIEEAEKE